VAELLFSVMKDICQLVLMDLLTLSTVCTTLKTTLQLGMVISLILIHVLILMNAKMIGLVILQLSALTQLAHMNVCAHQTMMITS
jgi:hypothetical protein